MTTDLQPGSAEWLHADADRLDLDARFNGRETPTRTAAGLRAAAEEIKRLRASESAFLKQAAARIAELEAQLASAREDLARNHLLSQSMRDAARAERKDAP